MAAPIEPRDFHALLMRMRNKYKGSRAKMPEIVMSRNLARKDFITSPLDTLDFPLTRINARRRWLAGGLLTASDDRAEYPTLCSRNHKPAASNSSKSAAMERGGTFAESL